MSAKPPDETYTVEWRGIQIRVAFRKNWFNSGFDHIELHAPERLPVTETGYRSHFIDPVDLEDYNGIEDFILYWLDVSAKEWDGQLALL